MWHHSEVAVSAWCQTCFAKVLWAAAALWAFVPCAFAADTRANSPYDPHINGTDKARSGWVKDGTTMAREETYKGTKIRIHTNRATNGAWRASAEFPEQAKKSVSAPGDYASEPEAYRAALSAAMADVDRSRSGIGKP
jgi:hypothetical protein